MANSETPLLNVISQRLSVENRCNGESSNDSLSSSNCVNPTLARGTSEASSYRSGGSLRHELFLFCGIGVHIINVVQCLGKIESSKAVLFHSRVNARNVVVVKSGQARITPIVSKGGTADGWLGRIATSSPVTLTRAASDNVTEQKS